MLGAEEQQGILQDMDPEADNCRERLLALQGEFRKMEETVASMKRYKAKIDQLKQENANVKLSYETNLQKYCLHISSLERDNALLRSHIKKIETQFTGSGDDRNKYLILMDQLKMEKSSLVLETEQQRQHYERCLDDIANQVVQALLAQKTLREECVKLQSRVHDLEMKNKHLVVLFQQKMKISAENLLQLQQSSQLIANVDKSCRDSMSREITNEMKHGPGSTMDLENDASLPLKREENVPGKYTSILSWPSNTETDEILAQERLSASYIIRRAQFKESGLWSKSLEQESPKYFPCNKMHEQKHKLKLYFHQDSFFFPPKLKRSLSADDIHNCWAEISSLSQQMQQLINNLQWNTFVGNRKQNLLPAKDTLNQKFFHQNVAKISSQKQKNIPEKSLQSSSTSACSTLQSECSLDISQTFISKPGTECSLDISQTFMSKPGTECSPDISQTFMSKPGTECSSDISQTFMSKPGRSAATSRKNVTGALKDLNVHNGKNVTNELKPSCDMVFLSGKNSGDQFDNYREDDSEWRPVYSNESLSSREIKGNISKDGSLDDDVFTPTTMCTYRTSTNKSNSKPALFNHSGNGLPSKLSKGEKIANFHKSSSKSDPRKIHEKFDKEFIIKAKRKSGEAYLNGECGNIVKGLDNGQSSMSSETSIYHTDSQDGHKATNSFKAKNSCDLIRSYNCELQSQSLSQGGNNKSSCITNSKQNGNSSDSYSSSERITQVVRRDPLTSRLTSSQDNHPEEGKTKVRPGQLILAPEEKNFIFQGFSSTSSTSSEDKSPLKLFESKPNLDMRSSVIEVKQDGTFVHAMRSIGDSSSESSKSKSTSPCSPVKSPSKLITLLDNKNPESRSQYRNNVNCKEQQRNRAGNGSRNITVGFVLHSQCFPESNQLELVENRFKVSLSEFHKRNVPCKELGNHVQTKCQPNDFSFENGRVERSGSKDDGYSTMSSDILPEILERFSDTLTRKQSAIDCDQLAAGVKNLGTENYFLQEGIRRRSEPSVSLQDRSFDLMSDPDSALETSVHSTAEMVTSSSSQVSTSSSDFPMSPCSTNVSKMSKLFDVDGTKLRFGCGAATSTPKDKENITSISTKIFSTSSSPLSPNSFVPSSYQPPESPRRLAHEFHKPNPVISPGSSTTFKKISPHSPKHLNKSFGGFSLKQKEQTNGTQLTLFNRKVVDSKLPNLVKPQILNSVQTNDQSHLSLGVAVPTSHGLKNKSQNVVRIRAGANIAPNITTTLHQTGQQVESDTISQIKIENKLTTSLPSSKKEAASTESSLAGASPDGDKHNVKQNETRKQNSVQCKKLIPAINSSISISNHNLVQPNSSKVITPRNDTRNMTNSISNFSKISGPTKLAKTSQSSVNTSDKTTVKTKQTRPRTDSTKIGNPVYISKIVMPLRQCNLSTNKNLYNSSDSSLQAASSPSTLITCDIPSTSEQLNCLDNSGRTIIDQVTLDPALAQRLNACVYLTNNGYQNISDSENNEDVCSAFNRTLNNVYAKENHQYKKTNVSDCNNCLNVHYTSSNSQTSNIQATNILPFCLASELEESSHLPNVPMLPSGNIYCNNQSSSVSKTHSSLPENHFSSSQSTSPLSLTTFFTNKSRNECLPRSLSESDLLQKPQVYKYSYCVLENLSCNKVLTRCVSVQELNTSSHWSWPFGQDKVQPKTCLKAQDFRHHLRLPIRSSFRQDISSTDSPSSPFDLKQTFGKKNQQNFPYLPHYGLETNFCFRNVLPREHFDDDEFEAKAATYYESSSTSHLDMSSDESPRLNEQTEFQSQFYSLCKVDSNRSLLSSANTSREQLCSNNDYRCARKDKTINNMDKTRHCSKMNAGVDVDTAGEFDEISRQIVSLSKTVEELNNSLTNFNSGDLKLPACQPSDMNQLVRLQHPSNMNHLGEQQHTSNKNHFIKQQQMAKSDVIDGYHWADDGVSMISCNKEYAVGGFNVVCEQAFAQLCSEIPLDQSNTDDASNELCSVSLRKNWKPFIGNNQADQDDTFDETSLPGIKEKSINHKQDHVAYGGMNRHESDVDGCMDGTRITSSSHRMFGHRKIQEGGDNNEGNIADNNINTTRREFTDKQLSSNNDSDDSLASDIGLDHLMCQRLFHPKGCFRTPFSGEFTASNAALVETPEDFDLAEFSDVNSQTTWLSSDNKVQSFDKEMSDNNNDLSFLDPLKCAPVYDTWEQPLILSTVSVDKCQLQTRDVGIDVMSQSQLSMDTSCEMVDQSVQEVDKSRTKLVLEQDRDKCGDLTRMSDPESQLLLSGKENVIVHKKSRNLNSDNIHSVSTKSSLPLQTSKSDRLKRQQNSVTKGNKATNITTTSQRSSTTEGSVLPPKLPPREPIINKTRRKPLPSLEQDIDPLPPPPICLNNEVRPTSHVQHRLHHQQQHHPPQHFPYVNQFIPSLTFQNSRRFQPGKLKPTINSPVYNTKPTPSPPPLPPRLPHGDSYQDNTSQDSSSLSYKVKMPIKKNGNERPRSLSHYLSGKPKAALTSLSNASHLATYPGRRLHTDRSNQAKTSSSTETPIDETATSKIPRRRLKTRRDRSKSRLNLINKSVDVTNKNGTSNSGGPGIKQWKNINPDSGKPNSDSSCEDTSS